MRGKSWFCVHHDHLHLVISRLCVGGGGGGGDLPVQYYQNPACPYQSTCTWGLPGSGHRTATNSYKQVNCVWVGRGCDGLPVQYYMSQNPVCPYQSTWGFPGSGHWTALGPHLWGLEGSGSSPDCRSHRSWWWCPPADDTWGSAPLSDSESQLLGGSQGYIHLQIKGKQGYIHIYLQISRKHEDGHSGPTLLITYMYMYQHLTINIYDVVFKSGKENCHKLLYLTLLINVIFNNFCYFFPTLKIPKRSVQITLGLTNLSCTVLCYTVKECTPIFWSNGKDMPIIFVFLCVTTHAFQGIWFDDIIWSAYHYLHCPKNTHKKSHVYQ